MSCQSECISLCSVHCIPIPSQPPKSPCPDLLLDNLTPTDLQLHQVRKSIQGADAEILRLQDAIDQLSSQLEALQSILQLRLSSQLEALQSFVERHRGVASAVRRLPNEILCQIFTHSLNTELPLFNSKNALSNIIRVCARWRAVALASPSLWRHFVFDSVLAYKGNPEYAKLLRQTSLQLQRSRQTLLSVHLIRRIEDELLDTLLAVSSRWQSATLLLLDASDCDHLFTSRAHFTILKKLTLQFESETYNGDATGFVQSLPALVDFTLHMSFCEYIPRGFESLWPRLLACTLEQCCAAHFLPILPLFSPETRISIVSCYEDRDGDLAPVQLAASALSLNACFEEFIIRFLKVVAAPRLKKFVVSECDQYRTCSFLPSITTFLSNSSCTLTHLALDVWYATLKELLTLLALPQTRHVCALDMDFLPSPLSTPSAAVVDALATHDIVPNLRSLTLRNCSSVEDAGILALHASRRPVLQQLFLQKCLDPYGLSQTALQALKSDGLEVVIFRHLDYW
ncbi:hypothetical protein GGX14DRAFT_672133 [Mycena pura]|uniref:F-box domain-containing protein n=1 Tax=Mycena pura TaxID=153505 RepID=A0AAD6UXJ5_9AGAR|nr:hypothetical protein GGX14DRAFT_672133 [Mycena pura]